MLNRQAEATHSTHQAKVAIVALSPALFWICATASEFMRNAPGAFEAPLLYLGATYLYYGPIFVAAAGLHMAMAIKLPRRVRPWSSVGAPLLGAVASIVSLVLAHVIIEVPLGWWPLCGAIGLVLGITLGVPSSNDGLRTRT